MMDRSAPARKRARATRSAARLFAAAAFLPALAAASLTACAGEGAGGDGPAAGAAGAIGRAIAASLDPDAGDGPPIEGGSPSGSYLAGRFALDAGEYGQAAEGFDRALAADPGNRELRRQVFLLRLAGGDTDRAVAAAAALVEIDAEADEALLLLALDKARAGEHAAARELLGRVGERGALGLVLPVLDAWAAFGAGEVDAALARLGGGSDTGGTGQGLDLLRLYHRALMLDMAGRPAEALALLSGRPARDVGDGSDPLRIVQTLAHLHLRLGDRAAAERVVADALSANPDDPQLEVLRGAVAGGKPVAGLTPVADPRDAMADALIGIAEALLDQQAGAQALLLARAAGFVSPGLADARLLVGRILLAQESPGEAVAVLEAIPAVAPQSWAARLLRAQTLRELDRTDEAVRLLRTMAAERPARLDALVTLGDLHRRDERYPEAAAAYGEAVARLGGRPGGEQWRLFYAQGMALERTKRWPEAQAALERALELQPEQPLVLNYLGYSWVDRGENLDRGKEMLHRAVDLRPEDGFIVDSLGWAYHRVGEFEKAVTYLERAVELEPADPVINDHLGDAYWRVGRVREARFQWQRALSFKPEPEVAGQIQGKLERGLPAEAAGSTRG